MIYRFLGFELDETQVELRFDGRPITVQARVFALIAYLLRHRERVVPKDELVRELWKANALSDTAISQVVMLARKALRDEGENQRIIRTLRGRGFRFIAAADVQSPQLVAAVPTPQQEQLIGRSAELQELERRVAALHSGRGGLALIEGEPGVGKTTLADALAARVALAGVDVQWGRAWEEGGAPPFWPWIQVLRGLRESDGEAALRRCMGRSVHELTALLPELATTPDDAVVEADRARAHFRLFDAMAGLLRACGAARPRLIVLEDLHAVDEASVQMLRFLAPDLEQCAVLVVGTFRDFALQRQPLLAQLAEGRRLRLGGLPESDVARWLERALGRSPEAELTRTLHELSDGNPLLLAELYRRVQPDRPEQLAALRALSNESLPERILRAVRSHLDELPEATLRALSTASALGREFALSVLAPLCECSEPELLGLLAPALQRAVVRQGSGPELLIFSHAMVRQAVYANLPHDQRLDLHRRIAELLVRSHAPERAPLYEIAHHYGLAAAAGCRRQALQYARAAAAHAHSMRAYEVAAELYDRACALAESEAADGATLHELLCSAAEAWYRVGELQRCAARFERAATLARAEQQAERFAMAVLGWASGLRGAMLYDRHLQAHLQEALDMLPEGDCVGRAGLLSTRAINLRAPGTSAERDAASRAAVEMARRLGDDAALQWVLNGRHLATWGAAHPRELLELTGEMIALARKTGDHEVLLDALIWRIADYAELGDILAAQRARGEYAFEVERVGSPFHRYMLLTVDGLIAHELGDFEGARLLSLRTRDWGVRLREPFAEAFFAIRELFRGAELGCVPEELSEPPSCVPADFRPLWMLAWAIHGKRVDAERCVVQSLTHEAAGLVLDAVRRPLLCVMAEVCARLSHRELAARVYPLLAPLSGLHAHLQAGVHIGPINFYLGRLAATCSQHEAASVHFEQALLESEYLMPTLARTEYEFGRMLAAAANPRGRELLAAARSHAEQLGLTVLCRAAEHELTARC
ncbi:MAG TPA: AAA family ATPase [Polyangiales bacterium]|nr:AAA family ATPase [Polyangiales bacterium]